MSGRLKTILWSVILIIAVLVLLRPVAPVFADDDEGTVTVYNYTDRDLYIIIAGRNQGNVSKGYSETYRCKHGNHRVVAQWDGGEVYKYVTVSKNNPRAEWQINQNDVD